MIDRGRRLRTRAAMFGGALALALVVTLPQTVVTEAAFLDSERAGGTLTAYVVPRPSIFSPCSTNPGLLGATPSVTIEWSLPAGYALSSVRYGVGTSPTTLQAVTTNYTTTLVSTGRYRTVFSGGLLSSLLGGSASVGIRTLDTANNNWTSQYATATAGSALFGANPYCTVNA